MLYPNKLNKSYQNKITYANRGMDLENLINDANKYYLESDIAIIYKKPTPIKVNEVNFKTGKPIVTKGLFNQKSTLDYVGLYKGKYLDFDAKKTLNKSSFPLENLHSHQLEHIKRIIKHHGIAFLIIEITNNIYILPGEKLIEFINNSNRKSIPLTYLKNNAYLVNYTYNPVIDYLKVIDNIYFKDWRDYEKTN